MNIYQAALDAKFGSIMQTISKELGFGRIVDGLTAERREIVQSLAEQSIFNWAVERRMAVDPPPPFTNLQHLLDEYCALAEYL